MCKWVEVLANDHPSAEAHRHEEIERRELMTSYVSSRPCTTSVSPSSVLPISEAMGFKRALSLGGVIVVVQ